jgi:Na+/proline symporter/signal transduction histidine kinase
MWSACCLASVVAIPDEGTCMNMVNIALTTAALYLLLLFLIAFLNERQALRHGASLVASPHVYALSLAVYSTAWTFYGSVGRATLSWSWWCSTFGVILMFVVFTGVLRKILRIGKAQRITSIADFISARYGKSQWLAGSVALLAVIGSMPYISLQLKAVSASIDLMRFYPDIVMPGSAGAAVLGAGGFDSAFPLTLVLILFVIMFGTRHVDATEHHDGMVAAIAFESLVKLIAMLVLGGVVVWYWFDGPLDLWRRAQTALPHAKLFDSHEFFGLNWWSLTALAMTAAVCLPRQFHIMVIENRDESHLKQAAWLFPLYLVLINLFIVPIALAGMMLFSGKAVNADTFVLTLPMLAKQPALVLLVFVGGFSAAIGMVAVEAIALSTMICNDLVMPLWLRTGYGGFKAGHDLTRAIKWIRRAAIALVLLISYGYLRLVGNSYALVTFGFVSFAAMAQFAPALIGGIYWKGANRNGALAGLAAGFLLWVYTLLLPSLMRSGWLPDDILQHGPFGLAWLRPTSLFGLSGLDAAAHCMVYSMAANILCFVWVSRKTRAGPLEMQQANAFVDVWQDQAETIHQHGVHYGHLGQLRSLALCFVEPARVDETFARHAASGSNGFDPDAWADGWLVHQVELLLASVIGTASARVVMAMHLQQWDAGAGSVQELLGSVGQEIKTRHDILRAAVENIKQGLIMVDAEQRIVLWNQRYLEMQELPDGLVQEGTPLLAIFRYNALRGDYGPGDVDQLAQHRLARVQEDAAKHFEYQRANGMVLEVVANPLAGGGMVTTYADITERHRAQEALEASRREKEVAQAEALTAEQHLVETLQSSERLLEERVKQRTLALEESNKALESTLADLRATQTQLVQSEKMASLGQLVANVAHEINTPIAAVKSSGKNIVDALDHSFDRMPILFRTLDNAHLALFLKLIGHARNSNPLLSSREERQLIRDLTAKLEAIAVMDARNKAELLVQLGVQAEFEVYQALLVHPESGLILETANSLANIIGSTNNINMAVDHVSRIVFALKSFSRTGGAANKVLANITDGIETVLTIYQNPLRHGVELVRDLPPLPSIPCLPDELNQVWINLIHNALQAMNHKGTLTVRGRVEAEQVFISIQDSGCGIAPEIRERIFEPFFTTKPQGEGSGLGLDIVKRIVEKHHGAIRVDSEPGCGSTFTVMLPLQPEAGVDAVAEG